VKLRGRFALPGGARDRLLLDARFGGGSGFDPATQDLVLALRDAGGTLYEVTLPAGTLATKNGKAWSYRDPSGSLAGLERVDLHLGSARQLARLKLRTIRQDLSAVAPATREVELEIELAGHIVADARTWETRRGDLVSGR
jgi:hypothetical protein